MNCMFHLVNFGMNIFKIATESTWDNLTRVNMFTGKTELTGFGREYTYLKKYGYYFDTVTKTMVKQGEKTWIIYGQILYLIFNYPHKHYTFKHFEVY